MTTIKTFYGERENETVPGSKTECVWWFFATYRWLPHEWKWMLSKNLHHLAFFTSLIWKQIMSSVFIVTVHLLAKRVIVRKSAFEFMYDLNLSILTILMIHDKYWPPNTFWATKFCAHNSNSHNQKTFNQTVLAK